MSIANTEWVHKIETYGDDHPVVSQFIRSSPKYFEVDVIEVSNNAKTHSKTQTFRDLGLLRDYLSRENREVNQLRTINVKKLSGGLIRLLGAKYEMDYELWTCRFHSSDREYFAAPLNESGPRHFSHFHLACVDFYRASQDTPPEYLRNRKLSHTVRLMRLIDSKGGHNVPNPRIYVIRRISGHLRQDNKLWTFLFFCDPFIGFEDCNYTNDIPGNVMPCLSSWISTCFNENTSDAHIENLTTDGFGLVVKILRDIKSTWKLLLCELEMFLEDINENFDDEEFVNAASYLHRHFILNIDHFQRQLFYHQRYVTYLTSPATHSETTIVPAIFRQDFVQEYGALQVVDTRLKAVRDRTTTVLEMILNLNSIKQARLASEMTVLQRQDAAISFRQGESIRRLTLVNMLFLPPSFVAAVFGMNTRETRDTRFWLFIVVAFFFATITAAFAAFKVNKIERDMNPSQDGSEKGILLNMRRGFAWICSFRVSRYQAVDFPYQTDHVKIN